VLATQGLECARRAGGDYLLDYFTENGATRSIMTTRTAKLRYVRYRKTLFFAAGSGARSGEISKRRKHIV
jgi:hypothetical protein